MANAKPVPTTIIRQEAAMFLCIEEVALQIHPLPVTTMHHFAIDGGGLIISSILHAFLIKQLPMVKQ